VGQERPQIRRFGRSVKLATDTKELLYSLGSDASTCRFVAYTSCQSTGKHSDKQENRRVKQILCKTGGFCYRVHQKDAVEDDAQESRKEPCLFASSGSCHGHWRKENRGSPGHVERVIEQGRRCRCGHSKTQRY
jgi:hypothetical protein